METIRYTVWVGDKQVKLTPKGSKSNDESIPYMPNYLIDGAGDDGRLTFLQPVQVPAGESDLTVKMIQGGRVGELTIHPALAGVDATATIGGVQHVFFPGESALAKLRLSGPAGARLKGRAVVQDLRLADAWGESNWGADVREVQVAKRAEVPVDVTLDDSGKADLDVRLPDDRYGLVGVTVILSDGDKLFAKYLGAAAIVPQRDVSQFRDGMFMTMFHPGPDDALAPAYKRIGIDWVRTEFGWANFEPQKGQFNWTKADQIHEVARQNKLYVMNLASHAPKWAQPTGNLHRRPL